MATFVTWGTKLASYEKKTGRPRRLYYFDPNHGCFFSEDELSFHHKFEHLVAEHTERHPETGEFRNPNFTLCWAYFKAHDVSAIDDDADTDISSLFKQGA